MSNGNYVTSNGRIINIDSLRQANETKRAVGNIKLNARGDEIDHRGKIVRPREQRLQDFYDGVK
jgi:ribosomal protein L19